MIKEYKEYICDVCKEQFEEEEIKRERMPVMKNRKVIFPTVDICKTCLEKITVLKWEDVKGV